MGGVYKMGGGEPRPYRKMSIRNRRSIRLKGYDYSQEGLYFITICTHDRLPWFGYIEGGVMHLNEYGVIADAHWLALADRFPNVTLTEHQIMPNHMHGIIQIAHVGAGLAPAPNATPAPTVGNMVGAYKSLVAKDSLALFCQQHPGQQMGKIWQSNYYEHVIRNEVSHQRIADYIVDNPARWGDDRFYVDHRL